GGGGFLIVTAREGLSVSGGGRINADTLRSDGGAIRIAAREVAVSEGQISSDVNKDGEGTGGGIGGDIELAVTGGVSVSAGGQISSDTFGDGPGGSVVVDANSVTLSGGGVIGSDARGEGLGQGGDVTLAVNGELRIQDPGSEISSTTRGIGAGGSVRVTADRIAVSSGGAISVASTNTDSDVDAGFAGDLTISATDSLRMDNGKIDATSVRAGGGSISIEVANTILLVDSSISATAGGEEPRHNGGDLAIDPTFVILSNSFLSANAADGNGGDISIVAANFLTDNRSDINASSQFGSPGFIEVEAPTNDIGTTVTILDVSFVDLAKLLGQRCTPAALKERSSFVVEGRGGLPLSPEAVAATPIEEIVSEVAGSGGGAAKVPTYAHVGPVDDTAHLHVFACT
ncbi:MAG: hypothetical protein ACR2RB_16980, partial [Gammaproteobacteria bacterium]